MALTNAERQARWRKRHKMPLTRNEWVQIVGLITNIQTGRFRLMRDGEPVLLTLDEEAACINFRKAWASGGIEYKGD